MRKINNHILMECSDFTQEQVQDETNKTASLVCEESFLICRICGEYESGLNSECFQQKELLEEFECVQEAENLWFCFAPEFVNLQDSDCYAFGDTKEKATENLIEIINKV